jgi:hypothetical protein
MSPTKLKQEKKSTLLAHGKKFLYVFTLILLSVFIFSCEYLRSNGKNYNDCLEGTNANKLIAKSDSMIPRANRLEPVEIDTVKVGNLYHIFRTTSYCGIDFDAYEFEFLKQINTDDSSLYQIPNGWSLFDDTLLVENCPSHLFISSGHGHIVRYESEFEFYEIIDSCTLKDAVQTIKGEGVYTNSGGVFTKTSQDCDCDKMVSYAGSDTIFMPYPGFFYKTKFNLKDLSNWPTK